MFYAKKTLTGYKQVDYEDCEYICLDLFDFRTNFIDIKFYNGLKSNLEISQQKNEDLNYQFNELREKYYELKEKYENSDAGLIANKLDDIKAENAGYINRISYLEHDLNILKEKNEKLELELTEKNKKLNDLINKYNDLLDKSKDVYDDNKSKINTINNLMRINQQRSNAMRGLTPKTTHTGYVVNTINEYEQVLSTYKGKITSSRKCWRVYIQTPYMISEGITDDGYQKMLDLLGIKKIISTDEAGNWGEENVAFNIMRTDNYKQGFIEYSLCCTEYPRVTDDMLPPKKTKSKEKLNK